jgi:septal ring factor EnvC (AmiA/AmiB activator)
MATYYDLKQTGQQLEELLSKVPALQEQVSTISTEVEGKVSTQELEETITTLAQEVNKALEEKAEKSYVDEQINAAVITTINTEI